MYHAHTRFEGTALAPTAAEWSNKGWPLPGSFGGGPADSLREHGPCSVVCGQLHFDCSAAMYGCRAAMAALLTVVGLREFFFLLTRLCLNGGSAFLRSGFLNELSWSEWFLEWRLFWLGFRAGTSVRETCRVLPGTLPACTSVFLFRFAFLCFLGAPQLFTNF